MGGIPRPGRSGPSSTAVRPGSTSPRRISRRSSTGGRPGTLASASPRRETDRVEILSGVFEGKTTGTPISLMIRNSDAASAAYEGLRDLFRPGHGDITYQAKYGIRDHRGGGRASGRETAGRVAAGAVARKVIGQAGIEVTACTKELGGIAALGVGRGRDGDEPPALPRSGGGDTDGQANLRRRVPQATRSAGSWRSSSRAARRAWVSRSSGRSMRIWRGALMGIGTVKGVEIGAGFDRPRDDRFRLQRPDRPGRVPDKPCRGDPRGNHEWRGDRHPGGVQAHTLHRPSPGDDRQRREIPPSSRSAAGTTCRSSRGSSRSARRWSRLSWRIISCGRGRSST